MRQMFICVFALAVLAAALPASAADKRPNIVFFLVDDLGYMDVGCNNPEAFYETPNIDRLARGGMRFTNGYAANPVCSPTRYSIMAGKYPSRVGATNFFSGDRAGRFLPAPLNDRMPLEEVTVAEALKEHGYATFFAGKWHLGPTEEFWPEHLHPAADVTSPRTTTRDSRTAPKENISPIVWPPRPRASSSSIANDRSSRTSLSTPSTRR